MASLTPKLLYIGNANGANVYTSNTNVNSYTIIKNINACATTGGNTTITLHILQTGQTAAANNKIISDVTVAGNNVTFYNTSIVLPSNTSLYLSHGSNVTVAISGVEYIA